MVVCSPSFLWSAVVSNMWWCWVRGRGEQWGGVLAFTILGACRGSTVLAARDREAESGWGPSQQSRVHAGSVTLTLFIFWAALVVDHDSLCAKEGAQATAQSFPGKAQKSSFSLHPLSPSFSKHFLFFSPKKKIRILFLIKRIIYLQFKLFTQILLLDFNITCILHAEEAAGSPCPWPCLPPASVDHTCWHRPERLPEPEIAAASAGVWWLPLRSTQAEQNVYWFSFLFLWCQFICVESMDRCTVCGKNSLNYFLLQYVSLSSESLNILSYCASSLYWMVLK